METKDPIARLREIAAMLDDAAASMSEHGFSIPGIKAKSIADAIEAQYMRLPVDAYGVTIRIGDRMYYGKYGQTFTVDTIVYSNSIVYVKDAVNGNTWKPDECRHVKPDHVAEELAKFLSACGDDDPHHYDEQIAEFAERIRKVVEQ